MPKMTLMLLPFLAIGSIVFRDCGERSPECTRFFDLPREQRELHFEKYSVDKQIDLYLCGMKVEPPQFGFAGTIADRGETAVPTVLKRLKSADREIDQEDLIYILEVMSDRGLLNGRQDIIPAVNEVINNMKITQVKQNSLEMLKRIENTLQ